MKTNVKIVNAFTLDGAGGNPAGVVLDAAGLDNEARQRVAAQVGASETAFLERQGKGRYLLAFFTPTRPIANCGHATVATFSALRQAGLESAEELTVEIAGNEVPIFFEGNSVFMRQRAPKYEAIAAGDTEAVAESLGIESKGFLTSFAPQIVDTGNRFLLVAFSSEQALRQLKPNFPATQLLSERYDLIGFYPFALQTGRFATTPRMFAPRYGIEEEAATGMAAGPLAAALVERFGLNHPELHLRQGEYMAVPSPSHLIARPAIEKGKVHSLLVGGTATVVGEKTL